MNNIEKMREGGEEMNNMCGATMVPVVPTENEPINIPKLEYDPNDNRGLLERIRDMEKDKVLMLDDECVDFMRFLSCFAVGCCRFGIETKVFDEAITQFVIQMKKMGYGSKKVAQIIKASCSVWDIGMED